MILTPEQQALLNGEKGETMAKVVKTLVMYGDAFDAERMVPVTSEYGHTVISFGLKTLGPVYDLYQKLLDEGLLSKQKFTADPRPLDKNVPSSFLEDIVFNKLMYSRQASYEKQLEDTFIKEGGIKERMTAARLGYRTNQREEIARLKQELEQANRRIAELEERLRQAGVTL